MNISFRYLFSIFLLTFSWLLVASNDDDAVVSHWIRRRSSNVSPDVTPGNSSTASREANLSIDPVHSQDQEEPVVFDRGLLPLHNSTTSDNAALYNAVLPGLDTSVVSLAVSRSNSFVGARAVASDDSADTSNQTHDSLDDRLTFRRPVNVGVALQNITVAGDAAVGASHADWQNPVAAFGLLEPASSYVTPLVVNLNNSLRTNEPEVHSNIILQTDRNDTQPDLSATVAMTWGATTDTELKDVVQKPVVQSQRFFCCC